MNVLQGRLPLRCVAPEVHSVANLEGDGSWLTTLCFGATGYDYSLVGLEYAHSLLPTSFVVVAPQPGLLDVLLAGCGLRPRVPVVLGTSMNTLPAARALKHVVAALKESYLAEITSLYRGDGPESVHQARTSLRRLQLLAGLSSTKLETKSVSQVFHALGDIRNLDIVVAWMRENAVDQSRVDQALGLRTTKFNVFQKSHPLRSHRRLLGSVSTGPLESGLTLYSWATNSRAQLTRALVAIDLSHPSFATIHRFRRHLRQYSDFVQIFPEYRLADIVVKQTLSKLGQLSDLSTIRAYMKKAWPEFAEIGASRDLAKVDIVPELLQLRSQIIDSTS
ncbi:CHAD domain-containing protein [Ferrimicrobium sp.]|uniref:CHAD domain-containing protein n=1 Tax=Ferrimicrobium sp. TaxID=2926050 RepID=UPI0026075FF2|nr:CHAD domain-containing protein [Ferrimicrobium sp.]